MRWRLAALGLSALLVVAALSAAHADEGGAPAPEIYQVLCLAELDVIEVRRLDIAPETAREFIARRDQAMADADKLYVPDWHARLDLEPTDPLYGIEPTTFKCPLTIGPAELVLLPEPVEGYGNSLAVTLTVNGKLIVDDVPFRLCATGGPITRLTYNAHIESIELTGQFSGARLTGAESESVFDATNRYFGFDPKSGRAPGLLKPKKLRPSDIDYDNVNEDAGGSAVTKTCRYRGPGSAKGRTRGEPSR